MKLQAYISILFLISTIFANTISGKVINQSGKPVPGVNIEYNNTGTTTDLNGFFYIDSQIGTMLKISHIGYTTKMVTIDREFLNIILELIPILRNTIIVKSGFQEVSLSEAPTSISVIDQNQIKDKEGEHFQGFINSISNLNWTGGTSRARYYHIRGIGEAELYSGQGASNYSVGFTIDDIDFTGIGMPAMLIDIDQVEIYKGPQSSVHGSNSMAGLISMKSNEPVDYLEGSGLFGVGSDIIQYGSTLNVPIKKNINYRMSILYSLSTGFRENPSQDDPYTNRREELFYRGKVKWSPSSNINLTLSGILSNQDNGCDVWSPDNDKNLIVLSDEPGKDSQRTTAFSLKTVANNISIFDIIHIASYSNHDIETTFDGDWADDSYWSDNYNFDPSEEGYRWSFLEKSYRGRKTFTNEIRLMNKNKSARKTSYTIGVYTKNMTETDSAKGFLMGGDISDLEAEFTHFNIAGYAELSHRFSDKIKFDTNIRIEKMTIEYNGYTLGEDADYMPFENSFQENADDFLVGIKSSLSYKNNFGDIFFLSLSRGYKPGGINQHPTISSNKRFYDSEYNLNLELGYKVFKDNFNHAITLFNMKRENQQVLHSVQSANNPIAYSYFTANAKSGYNYGLELESKYILTENLSLNMNLGYLESMVNSYTVDEIAYGNRAASNAPKYTYSLSTNYTLPDGIRISIEYSGKDSFYISNDSDQMIDGYGLINASLNYNYKNTSLSIWGKNLADKRYAVKAFYFALDPVAAYSDPIQNSLYSQWGDPIEFGVNVKFKF